MGFRASGMVGLSGFFRRSFEFLLGDEARTHSSRIMTSRSAEKVFLNHEFGSQGLRAMRARFGVASGCQFSGCSSCV